MLLIAILPIMLLTVNISAGVVEHIIEATTLAPRYMAVGFCVPFGNSDSGLLPLKPHRFAARQFAAANSLIDPSVLPVLAPVNVRRLRRCNDA
jgi:hypothetical protein